MLRWEDESVRYREGPARYREYDAEPPRREAYDVEPRRDREPYYRDEARSYRMEPNGQLVIEAKGKGRERVGYEQAAKDVEMELIGE